MRESERKRGREREKERVREISNVQVGFSFIGTPQNTFQDSNIPLQKFGANKVPDLQVITVYVELIFHISM